MVVERSSLVSVLFREVLGHPNISFFPFISFRTFLTSPYFLYIMGGEEFQWRTISYRANKDLIFVHVVQLKPMIKAHS